MFYNLFKLIMKLFLLLDLLLLLLPLYLASWLPGRFFRSVVRRLFHAWGEAFLRLMGIRLAIHEHYRASLPKQYIVIANHPSVFEDIGMPLTFPEAHFLAKEEVKDWWIVGRIGKAVGTLFVQRDCKDSRKQARTELAETINAGECIGIFPEGGCKGRRIHTPFTSGAFDLSLETNVPIIPVFLHYEGQASFEWLHESLPKKIWQLFWLRNKNVNYHIFDPLYPSQFKQREHYRTHVESLYLQWQEKLLD